MPLRQAAPNPPQLPDLLRRLRKNDRTEHLISYLDTFMKTGSESIEAIMRRRGILFAGFAARMEDARRPNSMMFGELVGGAGCVGGAGKRQQWITCLLDNFRAFGINANQWTTAAQDEGGMAQNSGTFQGEMDRCRESQG